MEIEPELETHEELGLEDNGMPWPREVSLNGDITRELREDEQSFGWYVENIPDRWLEDHGLKRAPGAEWDITWREYDQEDIDHHYSFYFCTDMPPSFEVGDWHYRAITRVVKIDAADRGQDI